jgi:hypothetical protein
MLHFDYQGSLPASKKNHITGWQAGDKLLNLEIIKVQ